jgi:hypothetical protein
MPQCVLPEHRGNTIAIAATPQRIPVAPHPGLARAAHCQSYRYKPWPPHPSATLDRVKAKQFC